MEFRFFYFRTIIMHKNQSLVPFFFQLSVTPGNGNELARPIRGAYATLIIYSSSGEKARELMGRHLAKNKWQATEIKRIQRLSASDLQKLSGELLQILKDAQNLGIGCLIDTW